MRFTVITLAALTDAITPVEGARAGVMGVEARILRAIRWQGKNRLGGLPVLLDRPRWALIDSAPPNYSSAVAWLCRDTRRFARTRSPCEPDIRTRRPSSQPSSLWAWTRRRRVRR